MKLILLEENNDFKIIPETCIIRNNLPFFFPNFTSEISFKLFYAVKINRLGRHIETRFTERYYNKKKALAIKFTATDILEQLPSKAIYFDNSLIFSEENIDTDTTHKIEIKNKELCISQLESSLLSTKINETISKISSFISFKIGDILLFPINENKIIKETGQLEIAVNNSPKIDIKLR